jgi:DNA-binding CsgD family transcriptional regulator
MLRICWRIEQRDLQARHLPEPLSARALAVLGLLAMELSNREIARRLVLSVSTVKVPTCTLYGKLNVNSRTQALAQATTLNLLSRRSTPFRQENTPALRGRIPLQGDPITTAYRLCFSTVLGHQYRC